MTAEDGSSQPENRAGRTVELPPRVTTRIEARLPDTRFESVEDYATVALELLLREVERSTETAIDVEPERRSEGSAEGGDEVKRRLESLGYL